MEEEKFVKNLKDKDLEQVNGGKSGWATDIELAELDPVHSTQTTMTSTITSTQTYSDVPLQTTGPDTAATCIDVNHGR